MNLEKIGRFWRNMSLREKVCLVLAGFAAHGLLLLSDVLIWDGWFNAEMFRLDNWHYWKRVCMDAGQGWTLWMYVPYLYVKDVVFVHKVMGLVFAIASGILVYELCYISSFYTKTESLFVALLTLTYSGCKVYGIPSIVMYQQAFVLFLAGWFLAFKAQQLTGRRRLLYRVSSLIVICSSFYMASLLVFYAAFFLLLYVYIWRLEKDRTGSNPPVKRILSIGDYFLLPFAFWFIKKWLFFPRGAFASYYKFRFTIQSFWDGYVSIWNNPVKGILLDAMRDLVSCWPFFVVAVILMVTVVVVLREMRFAKFNIKVGLGELAFGVFTAVAAGLPYIVVGQNVFGLYGWVTKNSIIFGLPVAICLVAIYKIVRSLLPRFTLPMVCLGILIAFGYCSSNVLSYVMWQCRGVKDQSIIQKLTESSAVREASVVGIMDEYTVPKTDENYPGIIWTFLIKNSFPERELSRLCISMPPSNGVYYTDEELKNDVLYKFFDYMTGSIDRNGKQVVVVIRRRGREENSFRKVMRYWRIKYFDPDKMSEYLSGVTEIEIRHLSRGLVLYNGNCKLMD